MVTFLALYRGRTVAEAEVVGLSVDPQLVAEVASRLLQRCTAVDGDPVLRGKHEAQRRALRLLRAEATRQAADAE
jgi:hypothetical protein